MEQLTQFKILNSMKKLQSAYIISFLFFFSSLALLILHSIKSYSIISLFSVMKFNIDRNHMFLVCNGILVILVKSSSSISSSSSSPSSSMLTTSQESKIDYSGNTNTVQSDQCLSRSTVILEKKQEMFSAETSEQKSTTAVKIVHFATFEMNVTSSDQLLNSECNHVDDYEHDHDHDRDDEDEEGAEELNKRCEEFIRRMKQGIMFESRKDMIWV